MHGLVESNAGLFGVSLPTILIVGLMTLFSFYIGRSMKFIKLPLIIGYMFLGVILGPSFLNIVDENIQNGLSFITEIALGFVALSIGLELHFKSLKKQGVGIIYIIFAESFGAFFIVTFLVYWLTESLPLALIFGAIAPASAPAGTVAVIHEYKAKGNLTKALYAVVGFDDGLGIIIFGFAAAIARSILAHESGGTSESFWALIATPLKEVIFSFLIGGGLGFLYCLLAKRLKNSTDIFVLTFGFVLLMIGLCNLLHLSLILTNMITGILIVNTQSSTLISKVHERLREVMPLLFILFFTLAGTNLHISALPALGVLGLVYIVSRSTGLILGARVGSVFGNVDENIKKYLGLGILSQAGVAIGLSLIVNHDFKGLGKVIETVNGANITSGDKIGAIVLTTITATCLFFEIIGPILTKIALTKAGEINKK